MSDASAYVLTTLARNWWALILRGVIAIAFGLIAWAWPGLALYTLIVLFAVTSISGGLLSIVAAVRSMSEKDRWIPLAAEGAIGIGAGLVALIWPDLAAKTFLYIIAIWAILSGILEIIAAVRLRKEISNEWLLGLTGVAGIVFGVIAFARPLSGALAVLWLIGISAMVIGALLVVLGWKLRGLHLASMSASQRGTGSRTVAGAPPPKATANAATAANRKNVVRSSSSGVDPGAKAAPSAVKAASAASLATPTEQTSKPAPDQEKPEAVRPTRRERALQDLVNSLPPEGEGWIRGDGTTNASSAYPLKGNVNSRIYHAPGAQSYHETIAEVCFATDHDARRAGFRPRLEPEGFRAKSADAATSTAHVPASEPDDSIEVTEAAAGLTVGRQLDPVGIDVDGRLETLDDFGDEPEIDASATEDDVSSSGVEVTDGAAAGWTEIDDAMNQGPRIESGKGSVDEYAEALTDLRDVETEFGASDASETTPDAAIAEMDFDDDLVIDEALSSIESSAEGEVGSSASQDTTEQEPVVADAGNAESRAGESASSNEADDSDAYESIEAEIDAAFEAALEEDVSPSPESSHQLAGSSSSTDDDDATMRVASAIEDAQVAEMPSIEGERGESGSASHLEPPEPAATLVDDAGEGVASAIDVEEVPGLVDSAAEGDLADQDSESKSVGIVDDEMQVLADADSADSDIADTNLDFIETNQSSAELDSPLVASAATGSAAISREERVFAEMVSALSPEGERWIRGSGGYETPRGFPVKGNASSRLYHMPGGRNYTATIPEICFANAEDAQTAGFRARSGDPTEIDLSLVQETNVPERFGIRAEVTDEVAEHAEGALIGEGGEMPGEGSGWVRSDGSRDCPSDFPVKGNASSRIYHIPGGGSYDATIPEFCFASPEDAESAGFRGAKN